MSRKGLDNQPGSRELADSHDLEERRDETGAKPPGSEDTERGTLGPLEGPTRTDAISPFALSSEHVGEEGPTEPSTESPLSPGGSPKADDTIPNTIPGHDDTVPHDLHMSAQGLIRDSGAFRYADRPTGFRSRVIDDSIPARGLSRSKSLDPPWTSTVPAPKRGRSEALVFGVSAVALSALGWMLFWVLSTDPEPEAGEPNNEDRRLATAPSEADNRGSATQEDLFKIAPLPRDIAEMGPENRASRAANLRERAEQARRAGNDPEAERLFAESLEYEPSSGAAMAGLARAIAQEGRFEEALAWARRATEIAPFEAAHHETLGDLLWDMEHGTEAIIAYENAQALAPTSTRIRRSLTRARQGRRPAAP